MKLEKRLKDIQIALKLADWFSVDQHIDYDFDLSSGVLFAEGKVVFYTDDVLEFTESITPEKIRYRYQYMKADGSLIFRYDNAPHHREISTFPEHKHYPATIVESAPVNLKRVLEEIIDIIVNR